MLLECGYACVAPNYSVMHAQSVTNVTYMIQLKHGEKVAKPYRIIRGMRRDGSWA